MTSGNLHRVLGGRYRLDSLLGQGGMGAVYVATDTTINRQVAIKLLRPEVAEDPVSLERMREEAVSLAALRHPNVVQLYDFHAAAPDSTFIIMELVDGVSLARRLERDGPLPVSTAVDYARQVLSALSAAHAKGVIHRDIKPGNVLVVTVPMQRDLIKVLDFGIAKLTEETIRRRPTTAGILLGTPSYMSPEQASGRPIDARSDIYAAGLLLYTMLAGHNPFSGVGDLAATLVRVQSVMPPPIDRVRSDVSTALAEVLAVAMDKDPNQRFSTAADFVQAIDWATVDGTRSTRSAPPARLSPRAPEGTTQVERPAAAGAAMAYPATGPTLQSAGAPPPAPFDERSVSVSVARANVTGSVRVPGEPAARRRMSTGMIVFIVAICFFGTVVLATLGVLTYLMGGFFNALAGVGRDAGASPSLYRPTGGLENAPCSNDSECAEGLNCLYDEAGCAAARHCRASTIRNCHAAVPMCACNGRRSIYGPGGCAGLASEPWEAYACVCNTDADCSGGQRCQPVIEGRAHRPGATRECRAP